MMICVGCGEEIVGMYIEVERSSAYCFNSYAQDESCAVLLIAVENEQVLEIDPAPRGRDLRPSSLKGVTLFGEGT